MLTNSILGIGLKFTCSLLHAENNIVNKIPATFEVFKMNLPELKDIWSISEHNFNDIALELFQYQAKNNAVYAEYLKLIDQQPKLVKHYTQIPFLPISFFKTHNVVSGNFTAETIFESSSTTGKNTSKHFVANLNHYHKNAVRIFNLLIGNLSDYEFYGLLPNYLERKNSSLVSMVQYFMQLNQQPYAFYLNNHADLHNALMKPSKKKKLLFGVSFALLDFADEYNFEGNITIVETGGMKGRKKEVTKDEVYREIKAAFPKAKLISEYGMTELLSQAYSNENALYNCPPWMKVLPRADNDPLQLISNEKNGALNIIDLANTKSCAFIATDDLGKVYKNGSFEVIGRLDYADIRGCSLMI